MSPDRVVRGLNGPRGSALLGLAVIALGHGVAYSPLTRPPFGLPVGLRVIDTVIPLQVYAALWAIAGVVAVCAAFRSRRGRRRERLDHLAWGLAVGLLIVWGVSYLIGWSLYLLDVGAGADAGRSYLSGSLYLGVALLVGAAAREVNPSTERTPR